MPENEIKRGRKTKLTPELQNKICQYIRAGNYIITACQAVGISQTTYERWINTGNKSKDGIYSDFVDAIKIAEAESEARNVLIVEKAAITTWTAAAWLLERKHPDRWGRKDRHEVTGKDGKTLEITKHYIGWSPEEWEKAKNGSR
ncbi:MAG: hypothetical protein SVK08_00785 [Halobacteriota archaeon]|nr:hypothetical protein [Halobacteriota archaeon]